VHLGGKPGETGTSNINHAHREMTTEMMRQKNRMWTLLHPLARPLVNYRLHNKAALEAVTSHLSTGSQGKSTYPAELLVLTSKAAVPS